MGGFMDELVAGLDVVTVPRRTSRGDPEADRDPLQSAQHLAFASDDRIPVTPSINGRDTAHEPMAPKAWTWRACQARRTLG
jgi:hypothetical protein